MTDTTVQASRFARDETYDHVRFSADVQWVRGTFKCLTCGAIQADYVLPGGENVVTCYPCPSCGEAGEAFEFLELIGRIGDGPEMDFKPIYDRDVYSREQEKAA